MSTHLAAERLTDVITEHGEGAVWFADEQVLRLVDMYAGDVLTRERDGTVTRDHVAELAAVVRPRSGGGAIVATRRDVVAWDRATGTTEVLAHLVDGDDHRLNEGACAPDGAFLVGSMSLTGGSDAVLYRVAPDGAVARLVDGVATSNGLGFLSDGRHAVYNDTGTGGVDLLDYVDGRVLGRRRLATPATGHPDGLCVDAEDAVWVALWNGSAVHRYLADGTLDTVVEVGARQVTSCALGGPDLRTLFITTSREGLSAADDPAAGSLFAVDVVVPGVPVLPFGG
jgi:sugar lactone lactonase YvrE